MGSAFPFYLRIIFSAFPVPISGEEGKLAEVFIFTLLVGTSKGFIKALKAFMKPFEVPQRVLKHVSATFSFFHQMIPLSNYETCFLFHLVTSSFRSTDVRIFLFSFFPRFPCPPLL